MKNLLVSERERQLKILVDCLISRIQHIADLAGCPQEQLERTLKLRAEQGGKQ